MHRYDRHFENGLLIMGTATLINSLSHNHRGQLTRLNRPGDVLDTLYFYYGAAASHPATGFVDGNYRLQNTQTPGEPGLSHFSYFYDAVGNIGRIYDATHRDNQTFGYDHLNRLVTAEGSHIWGCIPLIPCYDHEYSYDGTGNFASITRSGVLYTYHADSNQPHAVDSITGPITQTFTYDGNGNMVARHDESGSYEQEFDVENRLVAVTDTISSIVTAFFYDAAGQRLLTIEPDGTEIYYPFPGYEEEIGLEDEYGFKDKVTASDGQADDEFGWSVDISGDTAIVGARRDGDYGTNTGSAYIYVRETDGSWSQQAKLIASDASAYDYFGSAVAISGDTAIVGANGAAGNSGKAYIFVRDANGNWNEQATLTASDAAARFGASVSISGDTAVVGAWWDIEAAYVFVRPAGGWASTTETAKLTASDGQADDLFGYQVAVSDDTVIVGARNDDVNGITRAGSAYIFERPPTGWTNMTETQQLIANDAAALDTFSWDVAINGETAIAGAIGASWNGECCQGAVYVFERGENGSWSQQAKLTASDAGGADELGRFVGLSGDTIIAGAWRNNENGSDSGAAYIFARPVAGWQDATETTKLTAFDGQAQDRFGWDAAISGNVAVVGAQYGDSTTITNTGSVYFFDKASSLVQRSTYFLAGQAVATRISGDPDPNKNGLFFLHSDHLGSNSFMTYGPGHTSGTAGALVPSTLARYLPFGDWRAQPIADLTDIGFTGHKGNNLGSNDIGLIYMNARFYVGGLNRFASADTLVPDPTNPQQFNRYSYSLNNPMTQT